MEIQNTQALTHADSASAVLSSCGRYRYLLSRRLKSTGGNCLFIMLNPSTADASTNDQTIRRCIQFARNWEIAELRVVNLFAWRSTDPSELEMTADPVGPGNGFVVEKELRRAGLIVAAWGNHGAIRGRSREVKSLLQRTGVSAHCLGLNSTGEPTHPLYVPANAPLLELSMQERYENLVLG